MNFRIKPCILLLSLNVGISSCSTNENPTLPIPTERSFHYPTIKGNDNTGEFIDTTIQFDNDHIILNGGPITLTEMHKFHEGYACTTRKSIDTLEDLSLQNDLLLFIDTSQEFSLEFLDHPLPLPPTGNDMIFPTSPYDSVMAHPAFIVNLTDSTQGIQLHDGSLMVIQEALNKDGEWQPIEFFNFSGCGNSYHITPLKKKHFFLFGVNQYKGDFKTKLRVKFKTNHRIIYSNEFVGYINLEQFSKTERTYSNVYFLM